MYFDIDPKFKKHFQNLKQVFLYITDECNLSCAHCIYKPNLKFHIKENSIKIDTALALISDFREIGAIKLSILGGEPTLYGINEDYKPLIKLINKAKKLGYEYIRMDTNGQFKEKLLTKPALKNLDELAFSLDGFSPEINDPIRGFGTFNKCLSNIHKAINLGYYTSITCCIHKKLLQRDENGNLLLESMIQFTESLGIDIINFHDLFKVGVPMDTWTSNFNPSIENWIICYKEIRENINKGKYKISIRLPICFITKNQFNRNPDYYGYCPVKLGERVMIHPNGIIRICSNLICTPYGVARYFDRKILWDEGNTNEIINHNFDSFTPCTNRGKRNFGDYVPLCFSFKPNQNEIIWKKLNWEKRRQKE